MKLTPATEKFVLHWGEMGVRWGMNRTISQIHALLYLADRPLHAEEIAETLSVARSNVSTSMKELQAWGLVHVVHVLGDRRDHFEALHDVWEIFNRVVEGRRHREIDPTLTVLRDCVMQDDPELDPQARERIRAVLELLELLTSWHDDVKRLPPSVLRTVLSLGAKIQRLLPGQT